MTNGPSRPGPGYTGSNCHLCLLPTSFPLPLLPGTASSTTLETLASCWELPPTYMDPPARGSRLEEAQDTASASQAEDYEPGLAPVCVEVMQQAWTTRQPGRAPVIALGLQQPPVHDKTRAWARSLPAGQQEGEDATAASVTAGQAHHAMAGSAGRPAPPPAPEPDPSPLQELVWHEITATPHFDVETQQQVRSMAD